MAGRARTPTTHLIQWTNRNGAIEFITEKMRQGTSFDRAFFEMKQVAKKRGFITKSSGFDLALSNTVTRMRNDCMKRLNDK